jgi:hypothetical protein
MLHAFGDVIVRQNAATCPPLLGRFLSAAARGRRCGPSVCSWQVARYRPCAVRCDLHLCPAGSWHRQKIQRLSNSRCSQLESASSTAGHRMQFLVPIDFPPPPALKPASSGAGCFSPGPLNYKVKKRAAHKEASIHRP